MNTVEKPSLLFVDDEPMILMAIRVVFRSGYDVTVTTDGFEAVELLKKKKFHVIISDQRMPSMTGIELLRHAYELAPNTVRILLTGYSDNDAIVGAINDVEVHRFLQKPWDNAKLKMVVDEAIALARSIDPDAPPAVDPALRIENGIAGAEPASIPVETSQPEISYAEKTVSDQPVGKEAVLIIDAKPTLFSQAQTELANKVDLLHASSLTDVFHILESRLINIIVCVFDVQSETDRTFLQMLKKEHPYILVIGVCDTTDSLLLIELINQARIYRFIRTPISMGLLSRYVASAISQVKEIRSNPILVGKQVAEKLSESVITSIAAQNFISQFSRINKSIFFRFRKFMGIFPWK